MSNSAYTDKSVIDFRTWNIYLKNLFSRLRNSIFFKNVFIVMSGTAAAQAIGFALSPVISRLFTPSDYGIFGSFDAVLTVIAAGVTLDYSQSIMLPKERKDAVNLFAISCISTFLISFLVLIACLIYADYVLELIKAPNVWCLVLLITAIFISGLNQSFQAWCVRVKAFKDTSASQVIRSLSSSGSQIGFGYLRAGSIGLIFSSILADILASINLFHVVLKDVWPSRKEIKIGRLKALAKEYRDFPMYSASMNVINSLSVGLPVLLLTYSYGILIAGSYAFCIRILSAPMGFVLRALRQVLFQKAAETHNVGGNLMSLYIKTTSGLFLLALFPSLILFIWAPSLFSLIFGAEWEMAGEFGKYLVLWMMFVFCNLPSVIMARIIRIQRKTFIYQIVLLIVRSLVLVIGGMYLSALQTVIYFSLISAVMNFVFIVIVGYDLMRKEGNSNVSLSF